MLSTTGSIVNTQCTSLLVFDYPANFKLSEEDNVKVYYVTALGVETLLVDGPDYAITLISETGFNVELVTSFDTGSISTRRETPQVQETKFMPGGDFPASAFEDTLDRLVMMQQEMQEILNRVIMIALSDDPANLALPPADIRALKYFTFDSEGNTSVSGASGEGAIVHTDLLDMPSETNEDHDDRYLNLSGENGEQDFIDFDISSIGNGKEGRLRWNDTDGTLNLGLKGGVVNLQIGQEMVIRAKNTSGSTIANGSPVRISGASGSNPEIGLSDADNPAAAGSLGLTTEEIDNNQFGYVTTFGLVRDVDTSGTPVLQTWNDADRIFVSDTAGELTNVYPTVGSRVILVGVVLRAHATEGIILVYPINVSFIEELSGNDDGSGNPILSIDTANKKVNINGNFNFTPAGIIHPYGGSSAPTGFLLCNGTSYLRTTYATLFDIIGITFGSVDSTHFNVPDFRGVFLRGAGQHGSMAKADTTPFDGGSIGDENDDKFQNITGDIIGRGSGTGVGWHLPLVNGALKRGALVNRYGQPLTTPSGYGIALDASLSTAEGGARTGDETNPANVAVNYIIKI